MRAFPGSVLSIIALGVLLMACGLLATAAGVFSPGARAAAVPYDRPTRMYQLAGPVPASERVNGIPDGRTLPQFGASPALAPQTGTGVPRSGQTVRVASTVPPPRQSARRTSTVDRGRDWKRTALVIGGATAAGAGLGAIAGGRKGAAIGAAVGAGAGTIYEVRSRRTAER